MENELNEVVMEEGMVNDTVDVNGGKKKAIIFGIVSTTAALLFAFRKKIAAKNEERMVNKLTKKGYTVQKPETEIEPEEVFSEVD